MKIFVSYTTRDSFINRKSLSIINTQLSQSYSPFIDIIHNTLVKSQRQNKVKLEIAKCDLFILIQTKSIYKSAWVKREINQAKRLNKKIKILYIKDNYALKAVLNKKYLIKS